MSDYREKPRPTLFENQNWFYKFFLNHLNKICNIGGKRPFQVEDLFEVADDMKTKAFDDMRAFYEEAAGNKKRSFFISLMLSVRYYLLKGGSSHFFVNLVQILTPIFLKYFLDWLQLEVYDLWKGYVYAAVLSTVLIMRAFSSQHAMQNLHRGSVVINNYVGTLISEKISNLPPAARKYISTGNITNFLTTDIRGIQGSVSTVHQLFVTPVLLLVYTAMIIIETKWVGLLVPAIILGSIPIQIKLNAVSMGIQQEEAPAGRQAS